MMITVILLIKTGKPIEHRKYLQHFQKAESPHEVNANPIMYSTREN